MSRTITLALIIRLLIIPLFYHPDIKSQLFHSQFLGQKIFNIYSYVDQNRQRLPYPNIFVYLPLTYFFFGLLNILLSPLYPSDLFLWLNDWGPLQNQYPNLPFFLLILKIPYLICDLVIAYLLHKIYKDKKLILFWLLNPITLYLIYVQGNFDVIPVMFTLLSYYLLLQKKTSLGFLFLGFAIALKMYPLLFVPFFLVKFSPKIKNYFFNTLLIFLPLIATIVPFLSTPAFLTSFLGSGLTQKIIELKLFGLPLFPVFYLALFLSFYFSSARSIEKSILYLFLAFVILVNFHPQWLLWFFPFFLPYFRRPLAIIFLLAILIVFLINDNFLFWGHLTPVDWEFPNLTSPHQFLSLRFHLSPIFIQRTLKLLIFLISLLIIVRREKPTSLHHH